MPPDAFAAWRKDGAAFGKFVLLEELGRGGQSIVRRAWQTDLRREVALKIVTGLNPELRRRFMEEVRLGARLSHPAIVPVFDAGEDRDTLWLCMPRIEGSTLDRLELTPTDAALAVAAAARGVQAAHEQGVIHRDLKPRNILKSATGVHILDFGLAKAVGLASQTNASGPGLGTPHFMSPEQAAGGALDARTDVYALGATLYALLAGRPPYTTSGMGEFIAAILREDPPPLRSLVPAIPASLAAVVEKSMSREPGRRYSAASGLADDLERFAAGEPVSARPAPAAARAVRWLKKNPALSAVAATLLVSVAAGVLLRQFGRVSRADPMGQALELVKMKDWRAAEKILTPILKGDPDNVEALVARAQCTYGLQEYDLAAADLDRALQIAPGVPSRWIQRAECAEWLAQFHRAEQFYTRSLDLDPENVEAWIGRSSSRLRQGDTGGAYGDAAEAVKRNPGHAWALGARAKALKAMDRHEQAIRDFNAALALKPREPTWLSERGKCKLALKDYVGALADLTAGAEISDYVKEHVQEEIRAAREGLEAVTPQ
jgi:tetratricopeptide (TPR) repeat protein